MNIQENVGCTAKGPLINGEFGFLSEPGNKDIFITRAMILAAGFKPAMMQADVKLVVDVSTNTDGRRRVEKIHSIGNAKVSSKKAKSRTVKRRRDSRSAKTSTKPSFFLKTGDRAVGRIKPGFNRRKWFGFIEVASEEGHEDIFVRWSDIEQECRSGAMDGELIDFAVGETIKDGFTKYHAIVIGLHQEEIMIA